MFLSPRPHTPVQRKPKILIEKGVFWEDEENPNAQIEAAKPYFETYCVDHYMDKSNLCGPFGQEDFSQLDFYRGGFGLRNKIYRTAKKVRENLDIFNCLNWAPPLRDFYVNRDYIFLDAESIANSRLAFPSYIRPCKGNKIFTGQRFDSLLDFCKEFQFFTKNLNHDPFEICLVSNPKKIDREWRLIFVGGQYVSGALYLEKFERVNWIVEPCVVEFGKKIAGKEYFLNLPNFVLDVCEINGTLFLLEINSIYTSSFYSADLDAIYKSIAKYLK